MTVRPSIIMTLLWAMAWAASIEVLMPLLEGQEEDVKDHLNSPLDHLKSPLWSSNGAF